MKVKCIIQFFDRELGKIINVGDEYTVQIGRGIELVAAGVVEDITPNTSEEPKATRKRAKK